VAIGGEKYEMPIMEFKPISDGTPQFKDFYIKNG
jgi:hypothetical protein